MKSVYKYLLPVLVVVALAVSCKKADYLTDNGVHETVTPLSNYDYLKQHSWKMFDTLIMIIDKYNLASEVNNANTFFAPSNYSINRYMNDRRTERQATNASAQYTMDSLYKYITADSVRQYLFAESITLDNLTADQPQPFTSRGNTSMAVLKQLQVANAFTERTNAPTYLLYLIKVRGTLDLPGTVPPQNEIDISVLCQTTGIRTSNGTKTLHVLNNQHSFVRF